MKSALAPLAITALLFPPCLAQEADPEKGKALVAPVEFLTREAYDEEAAVRIANFTLPEGVRASLFADSSQTQNPSAICFDRQGRLYIAEIHRWRAGVQDIRNEQHLLLDDIDNRTNRDRLKMYEEDQARRPLSFYTEFTDRIVRVEDSDGDGRADTSEVWADGFNEILDGPGIGLIAGENDDIYYTNIPHLWHLRDGDGDGRAEERVSLQDGFGVRMSISGHDMHGLVWGPDGKLYWSIGDRGYHLTTKEGRHYDRPYTGGVFRCDPDGSHLEEIYSGLRNPQELAFDEYGNLFTCDNNADAGDTGRLVYILEGGDTGWHHGHQVLLNFRNQLALRTPDYDRSKDKKIPMNPWMTEGIWEPEHPGRPAFALPPVDKVSWGPSGFVYNYGVTAMPSRYAGHFWVCNFGGAKGDLEAFSVKNKGAGFSLDHHEIFMVGLGNTDVEFGPDGRMYLSCFNNNGWVKQDLGNVYVLEASEPENAEQLRSTREILLRDFSTIDAKTLADLLAHPDMRVRQRAQFALAKTGDAAADLFVTAATQEDHRLKRLHGIWGLGQLSRNDPALLEALVPLITDPDAEVRAQAAKVLADSRTEVAGEALLTSLADASARVKAFAAIGVGKCGNLSAFPRLIEILAENDNQDVFLRHACVQGLWYLNDREKILRESKNESPAVRLGILLTLRKLKDPRVKYFLNDPDESLRYAAIRAINDLDLLTALPDLAAHIQPYAAAAAPGPRPPADHRDAIIQTRLINANFRVGKNENAANLLAYAAQTKLPAMLREQALLAIDEWRRPNPVDSTTGHYRPLPPESREDITAAVKAGLPGVFQTAEGPLVGLATRIALTYGVDAPEKLLLTQIRDAASEVSSRVSSLEGLVRQNPAALAGHWDELLADESVIFRSAVVRQLLALDPPRGLAAASAMARSESLGARQQGYRLLAGSTAPEAIALFRERLAAVDEELPGALLDLLESAAAMKDESIAGLLAAYEKGIDPTDLMRAFRPALEGGDPSKGAEIFTTHAAGQCSKCHKIDGDGGIAGPELTGIGARQQREYLLESLIAPSKVVAPGYGITLVTLKNGESLGGMLMSEDSRHIVIRMPDPAASERQIERTIPMTEVATRQPPVSAMPPMTFILTKSELRDVVAYLASLKPKKEKKAH
ncbi:MAG: c-type cytochrome [Verrucomicrobiaceae bacterium]|nr:c-type cytochrome [Verrucomicrobiaceae bacterium]